VCDRVAMLYQGRVQAEGTVDEFMKLDSDIVRQFIRGDTVGPISM